MVLSVMGPQISLLQSPIPIVGSSERTKPNFSKILDYVLVNLLLFIDYLPFPMSWLGYELCLFFMYFSIISHILFKIMLFFGKIKFKTLQFIKMAICNTDFFLCIVDIYSQHSHCKVTPVLNEAVYKLLCPNEIAGY